VPVETFGERGVNAARGGGRGGRERGFAQEGRERIGGARLVHSASRFEAILVHSAANQISD
jgi:hypothetical protein